MIPKDYRDLLNDLYKLTDSGKATWKSDQHSVEITIDDNKFVLWAGTDERTDEGFVSFALRDLAGNTLDTWYVDAGGSDYDFMNALFLSAKRHALGIPDRLAKIRAKISGVKSIGD
ncbi:hypothetical protein [Acidovorax sp. NB1]|uniref:hypothetical protein n=1 Tax=Acidovorax sp. NB1 TaxID=1943571 RepID=UPI0010D19859|nr:hypothetical protein [Acidovorax sp. NB1]GDY35484.1 hypothetical protein ACINB_13760 [Acidovorax sp. NB1]